MSLPSSWSSRFSAITDYGIILGLHRGNVNFGLELQRSTVGTTGSTDWSLLGMPLAESGELYSVYTDQLSASTRRYYYRARHFGAGYQTGAWSPIVSARPTRLPLILPDIGSSGYRQHRTLSTSDGVFRPQVRQDDGNLDLQTVSGLQSGQANGGKVSTSNTWQDGAAVTFPLGNYQNPPDVRVYLQSGNVTFEPTAGAWTSTTLFGSTKRQFLELQAIGVGVAGFTPRARLAIRSSTLATRTVQFTTGNNLDAVGEATTSAALTNAPAYNDQYTVRYQWSFDLLSLGITAFPLLTVAVDSDTTGGYVERQTRTHSAELNTTHSTESGNSTGTITVSGAGSTDQLRVRIKSFAVGGAASTSDVDFAVHAWTGTTGGKNGITYYTASTSVSYAPVCVTTNDTVGWVAKAYQTNT